MKEIDFKPLEEMTPVEMMEELRQRRKYDLEHDDRLEQLGKDFEDMEKEVVMLRAILSQQIIGVIIASSNTKFND